MIVLLIVFLVCIVILIIGRFCWKKIMIWHLWKLHYFANDFPQTKKITKEYLHRVKNHYDKTVEDDLELVKVFNQLNTTRSKIGSEYMYARMYMTPNHHQELEQMIRRLENKKVLKKVLYEFYCLEKGFSGGLDLFDDDNVFELKDYFLLAVLYLALFGIILSGILGDYENFIFLFLWLMADCALYSYFQRKSDGLLTKATSYCYVVNALKSFERLNLFNDDLEVKKIVQRALRSTWLSRVMLKLTLIDIFFIMEFVKAILMIPVIQYLILFLHQERLRQDYLKMYEAIGLVDMAITIADLRKKRKTCIPDHGQEIKMECQNCYHPLIKNAVANSFTTNCSCIITGSNASGKSTFLKTLGVNLVMAKAYHTCFSESFYYVDLPICTAIHIKDDLIANESYYVKEIKTLKAILEKVWQQPCFVFIDEILRGTNEKERIEISRVIVNELFNTNSLVFVTTHDLALVDYFLDRPQYCFMDEVKDNQLYCDYKIKKGVSKIGNAIKLLHVYNFDERILKAIDNQNLKNKEGN